jgi:hypothetical protein
VNIELWKGSATAKTLDIVQPSTVDATKGTQPWTILTTLAAGRDYYIKIYQSDAPEVFGRSEGFLTINKGRGASTGKLWVNSTPVPNPNEVGAMIYIDGVLQTTPNGNILTNYSFTLSSGSHDVGVERAGYYAVETTSVDVPLSGTKSQNFPLELIITDQPNDPKNDCPPLGTMEIRSTPEQDAKITIRDQQTGKEIKGLFTDTKTQIAPGTYTVTVEHDRYLTATQTGVIIKKPACPAGEERAVSVVFDLEAIPTLVKGVKVLILPQPLNIGKTGYFAAIVTLPKGEKAADVDAGTVTCNDAKALTLLRDAKWFPQTFVAIFSRQDLDPTQTGQVTMYVKGSIKKSGGNPEFEGYNTIQVTNKKTTAKEAIDDWKKMTPLQFITIFFR